MIQFCFPFDPQVCVFKCFIIAYHTQTSSIRLHALTMPITIKNSDYDMTNCIYTQINSVGRDACNATGQ
jgi:hypothetical protein